MHQDLERLINLAKENGELTEKQKEVILRKACALGEDLDEIEIILESISHNQEIDQAIHHSARNLEEKKRCPNCGAIITDVVMKCPECGFVFTNVDVPDSTGSLFDTLNKVNGDRRRKQIIESFPVPNSKSDLLDFLLLSKPYLKDVKGPFARAYFKKYSECIGRCKQFFPNDPDFIDYIKEYEEVTIVRKKKQRKSFVIVLVMAAVFSIVAFLFVKVPVWKVRSSLNTFRAEMEIGDIHQAYKQLDIIVNEYPEEVISILRASLNSEYCSKTPDKADSILRMIFDKKVLYEQIENKGSLWELTKKCADYHVEIGDINGLYDVLKYFDNSYPNDLTMLSYKLNSELYIFLSTGNKQGVVYTMWLANMIFKSAPDDIRESVLKLLSDKISNTKEYAAFGYMFDRDSVVVKIEPNSPAANEGVLVGDRLISRETEVFIKQREKRASEGTLYRHVFNRGEKEYAVDLSYAIFTF